jgi:hypothetical protein
MRHKGRTALIACVPMLTALHWERFRPRPRWRRAYSKSANTRRKAHARWQYGDLHELLWGHVQLRRELSALDHGVEI